MGKYGGMDSHTNKSSNYQYSDFFFNDHSVKMMGKELKIAYDWAI